MSPAPLPGDLQITLEAGAPAVLRARGEVDIHTAPTLRDGLRRAVEEEDGDVIVDLCAVEHMDSSGLATLMNAVRRLTRASRRMVVVCDPGPVRRLFELTRISEDLGVVADLSEAHRRLAERG
jgi:anti-sigma B factor antagonist